MPQFHVSTLARLMATIEVQARCDIRAGFLYTQLCRYVQAYARGHFETAALYGRRMTEAFCMLALPEGHEAKEKGLCEQVWALPFWYERVYAYIQDDPELVLIADEMGMSLTVSNVWWDLTVARRYGNDGAHVSDEQLYQQPLAVQEETFVSTVRIALATLVLLRKKPQGYLKGAKL